MTGAGIRINRVTVWQTSDGQRFDLESKAREHKKRVDFESWYRKSRTPVGVDPEEMFEFLDENWHAIADIIEGREE